MGSKKVLKKGFALVTVFCMLMMSISCAFTDVPQDHWANSAINDMVANGVLSGYSDGTFKPESSITRAEFATVLVKTLKIESAGSTLEFKDIEGVHWAEPYVDLASPYLTGYMLNREYYFKPDAPALREDAAVAIVKAKELSVSDADLSILDRFNDKEAISENLRKYVAVAVENGLMKGNSNGSFNPQGNLTRAEVAALFNNIYEFEKVVIGEELGENGELPKFTLNEEDMTIDLGSTYEKYEFSLTNSGHSKWYGPAPVISTKIDLTTVIGRWDDFDRIVIEEKVNSSNEPVEIKVPKYRFTVNYSNGAANQYQHIPLQEITYRIILDENEEFKGITNTTNIDKKDITVRKDKDENNYYLEFSMPRKDVWIEVDVGTNNSTEILYGDAYEDGKISMADSATILRYINGYNPTINLKNADVNLDGKVDKFDNLLIRVHLIDSSKVSFPYKGEVIYFDFNDGTGNFSYQLFKTGETKAIDVFNMTTREGYTLKGWSTSPNGKVEYLDGAKYTATKDATLYAIWESDKNVLYGDVNDDGVVDVDDVVLIQEYIDDNTTKINLVNADINKDGKIDKKDVDLVLDACFEDVNILYGDANNDGKVSAADVARVNAYCLGKITENDLNLKNVDMNLDGKVDMYDCCILKDYDLGKLTSMPYTGKVVYFKPDTANTNSFTYQFFTTGETKALMPNAFTKEGYTFKGWSTSPNGKVEYANGAKYTATKDITLYAVWGANNLQASHKCNTHIRYMRGSINEDYHEIEMFCECGKRMGVKQERHHFINGKCECSEMERHECRPSREEITGSINEGYHEIRMFCECGRPVRTIKEAHYFLNGRCECGYREVEQSKGLYGDANNDGEVNSADTTQILRYAKGYDVTINLGNSDVNNDGKVNEFDAYIVNRYVAKIIGNLPYDGKMIIYNSNNGKNQETTQCFKYGETGILAEKDEFENPGYVMKGWSSTPTGNVIFEPGTNYTAYDNIILYAVWEKVDQTDMLGDVNNDGDVNSTDTTLLLRYVKGYDETINLSNSDVNKDGKVDEYDPYVLFNYVLKTIDSLPYTGKIIIFKANDGTDNVKTKLFSSSETVTFDVNFKDSDSTLKGWATSPAGKALYKDGRKYRFSKNMTLYAIWK